jgi:hypothetical protein
MGAHQEEKVGSKTFIKLRAPRIGLTGPEEGHMEHSIFTWDNFITWAVCSFFIYLSLNFRLYMIFHHPGRKLRRKAARKQLPRTCSGPLCAKGST